MVPVIRLANVTRKFGGKLALNDVSFDIPSGCVFALLGENGAGKTTAIRNILGLDRPNFGQLSVLGLEPSRFGIELRKLIGYVPDSPALYEWMTIDEIGWFTAGFYPQGFQDQFHRLCASFDLDMNQKIKSLSKGGKAKVGLALAMAPAPEILIMDEPTSGLDTIVRRKFLESMVDVAATGRTVLLSSHQITEVERVADHVAIIHQGQVLVQDTLEDLKQRFETWVISMESDTETLPGFSGRILTHDGRNSRRQKMMILDPDPNALWQLRDSSHVVDVEVHPPSLEDIFIAAIEHGKPLNDVRSDSSQSAPIRQGDA
ncbi:MAG: ABC transporter ATP-binding protein [Planctomycetota bacterium]